MAVALQGQYEIKQTWIKQIQINQVSNLHVNVNVYCVNLGQTSNDVDVMVTGSHWATLLLYPKLMQHTIPKPTGHIWGL